jgi:hypothetical protein
MDGSQFDDIMRALSASRRTFFSAALVIGMGRLGPFQAKAKKKHKHRHKKRKPKATPNEFGCLEVGAPCTSEEQCCSGVCDGKKGKKQCQAHGAGTCEQEGQHYCAAVTVPYCNNSISCVCGRTTAGSNFCGTVLPPSDCADCQRDADCEALGFPVGSVCAPWSSGNCVGICDTGMVCLAPCGTESTEA